MPDRSAPRRIAVATGAPPRTATVTASTAAVSATDRIPRSAPTASKAATPNATDGTPATNHHGSESSRRVTTGSHNTINPAARTTSATSAAAVTNPPSQATGQATAGPGPHLATRPPATAGSSPAR